LTAREDLNRLEYEILRLTLEVAEQAELIRNVSRAVAACGSSLAEVAVYQGYCRPYGLKDEDYDY